MTPRLLVLDDGLPGPLAAELRARGREARSVAELGLRGAGDAEVLAGVGRGGVLVTTDERLSARAGAVAVALVARPPAEIRLDRWRRDIVHRWAGVMAAQGRATARRYGAEGHRPLDKRSGRSLARGR